MKPNPTNVLTCISCHNSLPDPCVKFCPNCGKEHPQPAKEQTSGPTVEQWIEEVVNEWAVITHAQAYDSMRTLEDCARLHIEAMVEKDAESTGLRRKLLTEQQIHCETRLELAALRAELERWKRIAESSRD